MAFWLLLSFWCLLVTGRYRGAELAVRDNSERAIQEYFVDPAQPSYCLTFTYKYLVLQGAPTNFWPLPPYGFVHSLSRIPTWNESSRFLQKSDWSPRPRGYIGSWTRRWDRYNTRWYCHRAWSWWWCWRRRHHHTAAGERHSSRPDHRARRPGHRHRPSRSGHRHRHGHSRSGYGCIRPGHRNSGPGHRNSRSRHRNSRPGQLDNTAHDYESWLDHWSHASPCPRHHLAGREKFRYQPQVIPEGS